MADAATLRRDLAWAVDLALTGDWAGAHAIVQAWEPANDPLASWVHAVLHKQEGDADNARYWYRQAGRFFEAYGDVPAELTAIRAVLTY